MNGLDQITGGPAVDMTEMGNKAMAPKRAIDKLLMQQQQSQPRSMAFPDGIQQQSEPMRPPVAANSFLNSILGPTPPMVR